MSPGFDASVMTYLLMVHLTVLSVVQAIQGDSGGKANILGGDSISHYKKIIHGNTCLFLNFYPDGSV